MARKKNGDGPDKPKKDQRNCSSNGVDHKSKRILSFTKMLTPKKEFWDYLLVITIFIIVMVVSKHSCHLKLEKLEFSTEANHEVSKSVEQLVSERPFVCEPKRHNRLRK